MKYLKYRHKSILTAIISIIVMCGCVKDEIEIPTQPEERLYFNAKIDWRADQQLSSRAYSNDINFADRGFTVAGYYTKGVFSTSSPNNLPFPNVFDYLNPGVHEAVIKVTKDNTETNVNRQYWTALPRLPLSDIYCISYFAWSSSIPSSIKAATGTPADKGAPWIDAQVGAANVDQPDIVGAVSMNHTSEYTVAAIDLDFEHLLSKMSFQIKASNGLQAQITKVECIYGASAVYSEARFTFDGSADVGSWSGHKNYLPVSTVQVSGWNTITTTTTPTLLGSMTFIPQNLADNALKLKITYLNTQGGATSSETTRIVSLKALDMEQGKNYVYTLDVDAKEINVFNVKVESWIEISGTDKGLPLVPGEMDPNVLLLLEGTDAPYTTADGNRYWLDRSGWNHHCLIVDKMYYSGTGAFDITYDATKRGYYFDRKNYSYTILYNYIQIPNLGYMYGNLCFEMVSSDESPNNTSTWEYTTPIAISRTEKSFGGTVTESRAFLVHTKTWGRAFVCDYAKNGSPDFERLQFDPRAHDWSKISFYGFSRINGSQTFNVIDNSHGSDATAPSNSTGYELKHGMIGAGFIGIINYVKITTKPIPFEEMMKDYAVLAKKYYIKSKHGSYVPKVNGLLACWDARSGLLLGNTTTRRDGAYWVDQTENNYVLKTYVPNYSENEFIDRSTATYPNIAIGSLKDDNRNGVRMEMPNGIKGKYSSLTVETVSLSWFPLRNYLFHFYDKNGNLLFFARANTGSTTNVEGVSIRHGIEVGTSHTAGGSNHYFTNNDSHANTAHNVKRSLVFTVDFINGNYKAYLNGNLITNTSFNPNADTYPEIARVILFGTKNGDFSFTGNIFAFRIYNRELSQSEILTNLAKDKRDFGF